MKRLKPTHAAIAVIVLALIGGVVAGSLRQSAGVTKASFDWQLNNLDGGSGKLSNYRGQVVLINFWASWCGTCREEMPDILSAWQDYKNRGFIALGVNYDEPSADVLGFVQQYGIKFPIFLDPGKRVAGQYGVVSMPTSFLISRQGEVKMSIPGQIDFKSLRPEIEKLLAEPQ
jgi:peroxiredoxin